MFDVLRNKIKESSISIAQILNQPRLINNLSKQPAAYSDPNYIPVYYYIGQIFKPKSIIEIGFDLGLKAACLLSGHSSENYYCYQIKNDEYYSNRCGIANVKANWTGSLKFNIISNSKEIENPICDLAIMGAKEQEDIKLYLDILWDKLCEEGLLIVDYINLSTRKQTFITFCQAKNREPVWFDTRYGLGIVRK